MLGDKRLKFTTRRSLKIHDNVLDNRHVEFKPVFETDFGSQFKNEKHLIINGEIDFVNGNGKFLSSDLRITKTLFIGLFAVYLILVFSWYKLV